MKTSRALAIIFGGALLSGVLAYHVLEALGRVRPVIRGDGPMVVYFLIALVLPIVLVFFVWRKTSQLRFTGVLVALAAIVLSGFGSVVAFLGSCLTGGTCM